MLSSDQWPARKSSLVNRSRPLPRPPGTVKRGPRSELGSHHDVFTMIALFPHWHAQDVKIETCRSIALEVIDRLTSRFDQEEAIEL